MGGRNSRILAAGCLLIQALLIPLACQDGSILNEQVEQILCNDEPAGIPLVLLEDRQDLFQNPLNLNTATEETLAACGLFTSFQVRMITEYRKAYGDLLSVYELSSVTGFRHVHLEEILPFLTVNGSPGGTGTGNRDGQIGERPVRAQRPSARALVYAGRRFPASAAYLAPESGKGEAVYPGSPWKTGLQVSTGIGGRINTCFSFEKDPGESAIYKHRPEYLSAYLCYTGERILDKFILGTFRLHQGMGLMQGSGMLLAFPDMHSRPLILSSLKPYAGLSESGLHRGLATRLNIGPVKIVSWASVRKMDLSLGNVPAGDPVTDWPAVRREGGYHRTSTEIQGRGLGYLGSAGLQFSLQLKRLCLETRYTLELNGLTKAGKDSLHIHPPPASYHGSGISWRWNRDAFELYGELSAVFGHGPAFLTGIRIHGGDFLRGGIQVHSYSPSHRSTFAAAYASGSSPSNEKGVVIYLHAEPPGRLLADLSVEVFGYPEARYYCQLPSSAYRIHGLIRGGTTDAFQWRISLYSKIWQETPDIQSIGIDPLSQFQLHRMETRASFHAIPALQLQTRCILSVLNGDPAGPCFAGVLQAHVRPVQRFRCIVQFVAFHVPTWKARIYLHEPSLYHQFRFPVLYGEGQKSTLTVALKLGRMFTLEGKFSSTLYHDREKTGTGNEQAEGPVLYDVALQLRYAL